MKTIEMTLAPVACTHEPEAGAHRCRQCAWKQKPRTREGIEQLKHNWASYPSWKIERTAGFDDHVGELLEFSDKMKAHWKKQRADARRQHLLEKYAREIGTPGNTDLAYVIRSLLDKIGTLERANEELTDRVNHLSWRLDRIK